MRCASASMALALVLLLSAVGCKRTPRGPATVVDANYPPPPPAAVEHPATITGRITLIGKPPELPRLTMGGDPHCQQMHPDGLPDESIVVGDGGALANVVVYLKDLPASDGSANAPALLDQVGCQYVPHVVAVQIRQPLRIRSSDSVLHNVHILATINPALNLSEVGPGEQTVYFNRPEFIHVRCDVHPWMKAVIVVVDNPCFAVTSTDGKFTIRNVPPGTYTLIAWHERLGEQSQKVTVAPDGAIDVALSYR